MDDAELIRLKGIITVHEKRLDEIEKRINTDNHKESVKPNSLREFVLGKKPKTDTDKIVAVGYHLVCFTSVQALNINDIDRGLREARETPPKNINLAILGNVKKGYMMELKEKKDGMKSWTLTNDGMSYVENGLKKVKDS